MLHLESSYQPNMMTLSSQPSVLTRAVSSPSGLPLKPTPTVASAVAAAHLAHSTAPPSLTMASSLPSAAPIVSAAHMNGEQIEEAENSAQHTPDNLSSCGKPDTSPIHGGEDHSPLNADDLALSPPHLVSSGGSEAKTPMSAVARPFMPLPVYKTSTPDTILAAAMARKNRRAQAAQWGSDRKVSDHSVMKLLEQYAEDAARREQRKQKNGGDNQGDTEYDSRYGDDEDEELLAMDKASFADSDRMSDIDRESPMGGSHRSLPSTDGEAATASEEMPSMASMASEMGIHPMSLSEIHQKTLLAYPERNLLSSLATSTASNQGERKQKRKQTLPQQVLDLDDSGVAPAKRSLLQNQAVAPSALHEIEQRLELMEHQLRTIDHHAKRGPVSESELRALRSLNGPSRHRNRSEGSSQNPHAPVLLNNNNNNDGNGRSGKGKRIGNRSTDSEEGSDADIVGEEMQVLKEKLKEEISSYLDSFYGNICDLMTKMKKEWETKAVPPPLPPTSGPPVSLPSFSNSGPPTEHPGASVSSANSLLVPPPPALNVEPVLDLPSPGKMSHGPPDHPPNSALPSVTTTARMPRESPIVTCPNGPPPPPIPLCSLPNEAVAAVDRLKMGPLPGINMGPNPAGMFHPHFNHELSRRMLEDFRPLGPHFPCPPMPTLPFYGPGPAQHPHPFLKRDQEQTEALPLVVNAPKKKRTKVTDTRLSPRAARSILLGENGPRELHDPSCYPMVYPPFSSATAAAAVAACAAAGAPGPFHPDMMPIYRTGVGLNCIPVSSESNPIDRISPGCRDSLSPSSIYPDQMEGFDGYDNVQQTSTLTPIHLRKAKLMFFYTRYPSSAVLKVYFPDVKFNKNNTAQLVKWFSNFREFYYIQMEKYARQAIAEGVKSADEIKVSGDSELYRVLNLHYNRNNQIEVPEHFRSVVEATLREFYKALVVGKDNEQSWKKPIYKIIARLDQSVPDFFKSTNWMEQLADN